MIDSWKWRMPLTLGASSMTSIQILYLAENAYHGQTLELVCPVNQLKGKKIREEMVNYQKVNQCIK
jgi:hypothetical protein